MTRTLYYTQRSPYARKVRIVLAQKQLVCELKETDIKNKSEEFLRLSPIGKVPVLVDENGLIFWDSTLIVEYLDETYPEPSFYPQADSLTDNAVGLWLETQRGNNASANKKADYQSTITRLLGSFEQQLSKSTYLLGDKLSAIDVAAVSGLGYYSLRFGSDWQQHYSSLSQWFEQLHNYSSIASTIPRA